MFMHLPSLDSNLAAISSYTRDLLVATNPHAYHLHSTQMHGMGGGTTFSTLINPSSNTSVNVVGGLNGGAFVMPRESSPVVSYSNAITETHSRVSSPSTMPIQPSVTRITPRSPPRITLSTKPEPMDQEESSPKADSVISQNSFNSNSQEDEQQQHLQNELSIHDENSSGSSSSSEDAYYTTEDNNGSANPSDSSSLKCVACNWTASDIESLEKHVQMEHDDLGSDGEGDNRVPRMNSQGKVKTYRCKQCPFVAVTKYAFWEHSREHIKPDRLLICPKCPFVTEFKHHLEYHMRNHLGSKPFSCNKCNYRCVNKSMLNSHLKSHSQVYQYRCADCNYAVKYCHSLKLHLRKYQHRPDIVLNPDGTPNPLPIIDVYGTRRGPKLKKDEGASEIQPLSTTSPPLGPISNLPQGFSPILPFSLFSNIYDEIATPVDLTKTNSSNSPPPPISQNPVPVTPAPTLTVESQTSTTVQSSKSVQSTTFMQTPTSVIVATTSTTPSICTPTTSSSTSSRRKGKAFKLERIALELQHNHNSDEEKPKTPPPTPIQSQTVERPQTPPKNTASNVDEILPSSNTKVNSTHTCTFCDIIFKDLIMYTMHMGYHGFKDPFTCNMCGQQTNDKINFFLHIGRDSHH